MKFGRWLVLSGFLILCFTDLSDAIICTHCNMRYRGIENLCNDPRTMTDCIGCMKTVTKVKIRDSGYMDGWERMSEVVSKYCVRYGNMRIRPEGCYKGQNNGGYTEQCFCYTDHCNSGADSPNQRAWSLISYTTLLLTLTTLIVTIWSS